MRISRTDPTRKTAPEVRTDQFVFERRSKKIPPSRYSPTQEMGSTIAEAGLNFRVRNGNGCGPCSIDGGKTVRFSTSTAPSHGSNHASGVVESLYRFAALIPEYLSRLERLVYFVCSCVLRHMSDRPIQLVKPHERLVSVSSTHYCASTSDLSNSSSWSALQGTEVPGRSRLEAGFPLRCFQRLSDPNVATRLCHWRDNRSTIGSSIPVLSY